ncbi:hypothetical protein V1514DRAFT_330789 [Lipomyces japonicus]|uniref:uncharacterized protein n=1 Tax=Lipomyces japonicus TaxID=56871 RepID=UPI0034CE65E9
MTTPTHDDATGLDNWVFMLEQNDCPFNTSHFESAMINLAFHPNINSTSIMRADSLFDSQNQENDLSKFDNDSYINKEQLLEKEIGTNLTEMKRRIVRKILPRNPDKDKAMDQSCLFFSNQDATDMTVIYVPHVDSPSDMPYYHPVVSGIILRYSYVTRKLSILFRPFDKEDNGSISHRLERTALRLLTTAVKHSTGVLNGYQKRVHHDILVDQAAFQTRYIELKRKYAKPLIDVWVENTDPKKHVFEDLSIASFLIEFWHDRGFDKKKLKFVDIGCGNGVLVYILLMEGYCGYGMDARRRKTWEVFPNNIQEFLKEQILVPSLVSEQFDADSIISIHNGEFANDTFLIGNHSDELTPWIPLLDTPFIVIPCCSHSFSGAKHRYPVKMESGLGELNPNNRQQKLSTYGALVDFVARTASEVGWVVEREMLRIPSTRNAALIGVDRIIQTTSPSDILKREGGADGFLHRVLELTMKQPRSH